MAASIIAERGVEALSLREVARRLGVAHQARYKHFESRDHIVAELTIRALRLVAPSWILVSTTKTLLRI